MQPRKIFLNQHIFNKSKKDIELELDVSWGNRSTALYFVTSTLDIVSYFLADCNMKSVSGKVKNT